MTDQTHTQPEQVLLSWKAPIQPHVERPHQWYIGAGIVVIAAATYGVLSGAWTVTLVAILCAAVFFLVRDHRLSDATVALTERGAQISETFMLWEELQGFWILFTPTYKELHFVPKNTRLHELKVQTGTQDIPNLKSILLSKIPELQDKREHVLDAFIRITKL